MALLLPKLALSSPELGASVEVKFVGPSQSPKKASIIELRKCPYFCSAIQSEVAPSLEVVGQMDKPGNLRIPYTGVPSETSLDFPQS
jgi:hypothetical protein